MIIDWIEDWEIKIKNTYFGLGAIFAVFLIFSVELWLHTDHFLFKYRSVFAAGRAIDKILYVEEHIPSMLILGNSRVDNGFDPRILKKSILRKNFSSIFNLGIPGANARVFYNLFRRFEAKGILEGKGIRNVILGLDEAFLQNEDSLGYSVFIADSKSMFINKEYSDLLKSYFRLWGFSGNLKNLREPAKLIRFAQSSFQNIEPIGGGADKYLGYRAGISGQFQNTEQISIQESKYDKKPNDLVVKYFWKLLNLMEKNNISVTIVYPPLQNRKLLFLVEENLRSKPYIQIYKKIDKKGITQISFSTHHQKFPNVFANPGHLNDIGAKQFTKILANKLNRIFNSHDI